jgi:hypothetical protein
LVHRLEITRDRGKRDRERDRGERIRVFHYYFVHAKRVKLKTCFLFVGYGDFGDDFNLEDALKETSSVKRK